jgi:hypothetical protein
MPIDADKFMEGMPIVEEVIPEPYGEDIADAPKETPPVEPEPAKAVAPVEKPAAVVPPAPVTPPKSFVEEDTHESEQSVPVHVVADLRRKNRELKEQLERLETRPAGVNAENPVVTPIDNLPDDEIVTAGQFKKTIAQVIANERASAAQQMDRRDFNSRAISDEQATRAQNPDYDLTMEAATALNLIGQTERIAARSQPNPMRFLYETASRRIAAARAVLTPLAAVAPAKSKSEPAPTTTNVEPEPTQEEILDNDKFFDSLLKRSGKT